MDPELKTLLEQLISAVNTTNNTDWWMWGVTAISIVVSAILSILLWWTSRKLGKRQNEIAAKQAELQKQQNEFVKQQIEIQQQQYKIEKFNNYRDLHRDLYKCKCFLEAVLPKVYEYYIAVDRDIQKNSVDDYFAKLTELLFSIQNGVSDVMLRGGKQFNIEKVRDLLSGAGAILMYAEAHPVSRINTRDFFATLYMGAEFRETRTMEEQMQLINKLVKDSNLKQVMELFVEDYKEVFEGENNILVQLQRLYNE